MKVDEIKLRISKYLTGLITYMFDESSGFSKIKTATMEYWIRQNIWRLDDILNNFADVNNEIDIKEAIDFFSDKIFDRNGQFSIDLSNLFQDNLLGKYLPNKTVVFTKRDLDMIFEIVRDVDEY